MVKVAQSDGRAFTDYRPSCYVDQKMQEKLGLNNSMEYRLFLQRNGQTLINQQQQKLNNRLKMKCNCQNCLKK